MDKDTSTLNQSQAELNYSPIDINGVFDRICQKEGLKTDLALAQFLGVSKSAVNQARAKGSADLWNILRRCQGWDLNWLLRGEAQEAPTDIAQALGVLVGAGYTVTLSEAPKSPSPGSLSGLPAKGSPPNS